GSRQGAASRRIPNRLSNLHCCPCVSTAKSDRILSVGHVSPRQSRGDEVVWFREGGAQDGGAKPGSSTADHVGRMADPGEASGKLRSPATRAGNAGKVSDEAVAGSPG